MCLCGPAPESVCSFLLTILIESPNDISSIIIMIVAQRTISALTIPSILHCNFKFVLCMVCIQTMAASLTNIEALAIIKINCICKGAAMAIVVKTLCSACGNECMQFVSAWHFASA